MKYYLFTISLISTAAFNSSAVYVEDSIQGGLSNRALAH